MYFSLQKSSCFLKFLVCTAGMLTMITLSTFSFQMLFEQVFFGWKALAMLLSGSVFHVYEMYMAWNYSCTCEKGGEDDDTTRFSSSDRNIIEVLRNPSLTSSHKSYPDFPYPSLLEQVRVHKTLKTDNIFIY